MSSMCLNNKDSLWAQCVLLWNCHRKQFLVRMRKTSNPFPYWENSRETSQLLLFHYKWHFTRWESSSCGLECLISRTLDRLPWLSSHLRHWPHVWTANLSYWIERTSRCLCPTSVHVQTSVRSVWLSSLFMRQSWTHSSHNETLDCTVWFW